MGEGSWVEVICVSVLFCLAVVYFALGYPVMYGDLEPVPEAGVGY